MKRAFTLIEMLIVVAIIATLMTVVFRISSISGNENNRIATVMALQKLENCLSGYYAAFGSYPQVQLYGSRDIYLEVENGVQTENRNSRLDWTQVEEACRSQPVAANCPFPEAMRERVVAFSEEIRDRCNNPSQYPNYAKSRRVDVYQRGFGIGNANQLSSYRDEGDWRTVQIFRFGLMSFLLPRYLVMMNCDREYFNCNGKPFAQWSRSNELPCRACTGTLYEDWDRVREDVQPEYSNKTLSKYIEIANQPTQAICARWMPNLEKLCGCESVEQTFGIDYRAPGGSMLTLDDDNPPDRLPIYSPGGNNGTYYLLNEISVRDGWGNILYYYSPDGFQSYTLWSSGANGRTFPPWVDVTSLNGSDCQTALEWKSDDIMRMKN